ncbi:hypothetical protein EVJ58_g459 [Rhodofomes roseus]|uniref:Uncharacterized protein n=1 Tax=Rhodofomes roseus TaxID=34475 RepID=A0A4Y9Z667_9APHY|nr:hypothetical protein EVJ58_g459 [Rhodofomes roseus]
MNAEKDLGKLALKWMSNLPSIPTAVQRSSPIPLAAQGQSMVEALFYGNGNVNAVFPWDDNSSAVIVALKQLRAVDRNASLDSQNGENQTARTITEKVGMEQDLLSASERKANRNSFVDYIVSMVLFLVSYINIGMIKSDPVKGAVGKTLKLSSKRDVADAKISYA